MNSKLSLLAAASVLALTFCAAPTMKASTITATYSLSGSAGGDPFNPPLIGNATGTFLPLGSVTWSDMIYPDLFTGSGDGTFLMTFADGDTLFGTAHYQGDFSTYPMVPFTQSLTITGGTGELVYYRGALTGIELSNQLDGTFTSSGSGTIQTTPEPGSLVLLGTGMMSMFAYRKRGSLFQ